MYTCEYMAHMSFVSSHSLNLRLNWSWREVKVLSAAADATSSAVRPAPSSTGTKHQAEYSDMTVETWHEIHVETTTNMYNITTLYDYMHEL